MAMRITPGYDFSTNEVPTRSTLQLMLDGASLTGIDITQIDATLIGLKVADSSVSLPGEGWLWCDPSGAYWVKTRNGPVRFYRASWGGWETIRYRTGAPLDTFTHPQSRAVPVADLQSAVAGSTNESAVIWRIGTSSVQRLVGKNTDTTVSGAFVSHLVRGAFVGEVLSANRLGFPDYLVRRAAAQQDAAVARFPLSTVTQIMHGLATRQGSGSVRALCWYYGLEMQVH